MKRLIFIIFIGFLVINFTDFSAQALDKELSLKATASSTYYSSFYYGPDKAVDNSDSTFWVGNINASPWWIMFDTGDINKISKINIKWYTYAQYYRPTDYDIQISLDGINWENIFTNLEAIQNVAGEVKEINRRTRYIRLYIKAVTGYFPVLIEFDAYVIRVPHLIRFQGNLADLEGIPLNGITTLTFRLYEAETGGIAIWQELHEGVNIEEGMLDVELGSVTPLEVSFDKQYWLGIEVESDGEMAPRFKLTSVPYSFRSDE